MTPACYRCQQPLLAFVRECGIDYHCIHCGRSWAAREGRG